MTGRLAWIASYPKSGNTWMRVFLANLRRDPQEPLALDQLRSAIASSRFWIDATLGFDSADLTGDEIDELRPAVYRYASCSVGTLSLHKVHDAFRTRRGRTLFPAAASRGALYIVRNPLDVVDSLAAHFGIGHDDAVAAMEDPEYGFKAGTHGSSSQVRQHIGTWSGHVRSWIEQTEVPVKVVRYENLLADPEREFAQAAEFLGLEADSDAVARAIEGSRFETLRALEAEQGFAERLRRSDRFFRRGTADTWQTVLGAPHVARILAAHGETMERVGYGDAIARARALHPEDS